MTTAVTTSNSAPRNADPTSPPAERETPAVGAATLHSAITVSKRLWVAVRAEAALPALLTEREPAADDLRRYARQAAYAPATGPRRAAGIAWCYLIAIPGMVTGRLWSWVWQRPARALVVATTVKALTFLSPVAWLVDHVIHPSVNAALRVFL